MIDASARPMAAAERIEPDRPPGRGEKTRLSPVACAECGLPVAHMDAGVRGALAGGMCTNDVCTKDRRTGRPKRVYTYVRIATEPSI